MTAWVTRVRCGSGWPPTWCRPGPNWSAGIRVCGSLRRARTGAWAGRWPRSARHANAGFNYGLNPAYRPAIEQAGLRVTGLDDEGEARIVELDHHPFFVAT